MSNASIGQEKISFEKFMLEQWEEIRSPFNRWVTGEKVGHEPTNVELVQNYIATDGSLRFRERNPVAD